MSYALRIMQITNEGHVAIIGVGDDQPPRLVVDPAALSKEDRELHDAAVAMYARLFEEGHAERLPTKEFIAAQLEEEIRIKEMRVVGLDAVLAAKAAQAAKV